MKKYLLTAYFAILALTSFSQSNAATNDSLLIMESVQAYLNATIKGNSAKLPAALMINADLQSIDRKRNILKSVDTYGHLNHKQMLKRKDWEVRIENEKIHINDNLAQVWTPTFTYRDSNTYPTYLEISSYHLVRLDSTWKIIHSIDGLSDKAWGKATLPDDSLKVIQSIHTLFQGMQKGDSALVHSVFFDEAVMHSTYTSKSGEKKLKEGSLTDFLEAIGTPHEEAWNEKVYDVEVSIDGDLAHVWAPYSFYLGEKLLHCGVNSFHLVRLNTDWKIIHLIDTRTRDCAETESNE